MVKDLVNDTTLYLPKGSVAQAISSNSYVSIGFKTGSCATAINNIDAYEMLPNDPAVTGVPNSITGEITVGY